MAEQNRSPATGKPMTPLEITIPAEDQAETFNPASLVPFVDETVPEPKVPKLTKEDAAKWAGMRYQDRVSDEEVAYGANAMGTIRALVNKIPTPGRDAGDLSGDFSAFALAKDVMTGILDLMEMPQTGHITPEKVFQATLDFTPGASSVAAKTIPKGGFGMFGSKPSKYAAPEIHDRYNGFKKQADHMDSVGDDPEVIWQKTGMSKDHRGEWRYVVTENIDNPEMARVKWDNYDLVSPPDAPLNPSKLGDVLDAPNAYKHWPELKEVPVFDGSGLADSVGWYDRDTMAIYLNKDHLLSPDTPDMSEMRVIVHEAQHALQDLQGRQGGAGTDWIADAMDQAMAGVKNAAERAKRIHGHLTNSQEEALRNVDRIKASWQKYIDFFKDRGKAAYMASPGEVEGRMAEMIAKDPRLARLYPLGDELRLTPGVNSPKADKLFSPEDLTFPPHPLESTSPAAGPKVFGKRGVSQSIPPKPDWATHWGGGELRKHGPNSLRIDLSDTTFGQIKKVGKQWEAELRDVETGQLLRSKGIWKSRADAEAELRSMNPVDY